MSMQLKFKDEYNSTTSYYGTVDKTYDFVTKVTYFSNKGSYIINSIEWIEEPKYKIKAESRITNALTSWHRNKCTLSDFIDGERVDVVNEIITYGDKVLKDFNKEGKRLKEDE